MMRAPFSPTYYVYTTTSYVDMTTEVRGARRATLQVSSGVGAPATAFEDALAARYTKSTAVTGLLAKLVPQAERVRRVRQLGAQAAIWMSAIPLYRP